MEQPSEFEGVKISPDQTVAWPRVAAIAAMVSFSLPTFITGIEVAHGLSGEDAIIAFVVGSVIVFVIGSIMGAVGTLTRLSSYLLVRIAFGDAGARLVNLAFAISLLGWFGVNINLFSNAVGELANTLFEVQLAEVWLAVIASVCMTLTTLVGFRAINILSVLLVPVLAIVTYLLASSALEAMSLSSIIAIETELTLTTGEGVSAIVGAIIIGAIILPDITRFSRHWTGAVYTAMCAYLIVQLLVMASAAIAGRVLDKTDILEILLIVNLGYGAFAIVIAGSWILNSLNLYSAVLSIKASFPRLPVTPLTLAMGALGVIAALMNILDSFITFLFYLSVIFIPVAGVIIVDYLVINRDAYQIESLDDNRSWNVMGFVAWLAGALFAVLAAEGVVPSITQIGAIDAVVLSGLLYLGLTWRPERQGEVG